MGDGGRDGINVSGTQSLAKHVSEAISTQLSALSYPISGGRVLCADS